MPLSLGSTFGARSYGRVRRSSSGYNAIPNFYYKAGLVNNGRLIWDNVTSVSVEGTSFSAASPTTSFTYGASDWTFGVDLGQVWANWQAVAFYTTSTLSGTITSLEGGASSDSNACWQASGNMSFNSYGTGYRLIITPSDITNTAETGTTPTQSKNYIRYIGFGNGDGGITNLRMQGFKLIDSSGTSYVIGADPGTII